MRTRTPDRVGFLECEARCCDMSLRQWERLMRGSVRADKRKIDALVKLHLPDLHRELRLDLYNPYRYRRTATHLILAHSGIEYFLRYEAA